MDHFKVCYENPEAFVEDKKAFSDGARIIRDGSKATVYTSRGFVIGRLNKLADQLERFPEWFEARASVSSRGRPNRSCLTAGISNPRICHANRRLAASLHSVQMEREAQLDNAVIAHAG